jgi:hypothetical protein
MCAAGLMPFSSLTTPSVSLAASLYEIAYEVQVCVPREYILQVLV